MRTMIVLLSRPRCYCSRAMCREICLTRMVLLYVEQSRRARRSADEANAQLCEIAKEDEEEIETSVTHEKCTS
jgi:hypothetical protein